VSDAHLRELERRAHVDQSRVPLYHARIQRSLRSRVPCQERWCRRGLFLSDTERAWGQRPRPCFACAGTGHAPYGVGVCLGAYLGDQECRVVGGLEWRTHECLSLEAWLTGRSRPPGWGEHECRGLARWGRAVMVRAAVAAGRECLGEFVEQCYARRGGRDARSFSLFGAQNEIDQPRRVLDCAAHWLEDPSGANRDAWDHAVMALPAGGTGTPWVPTYALTALGIQHAASLLGPHGDRRAREAIRGALIPWCVEVWWRTNT